MQFLIRADGCTTGFVLVNRWSALYRLLDGAIAEFSVLRVYPRARVGMCVAHQMFRWPQGRWEIPIAAYNQTALLFWRTMARSLLATAEECAGDGQRWTGSVLCFDKEAP